jgi:hypothetical protein
MEPQRRQAAQAATDVEDTYVGTETHHAHKLEGGLPPANVKLVNRREVLRFEVVDVFSYILPGRRESNFLDQASYNVARRFRLGCLAVTLCLLP